MSQPITLDGDAAQVAALLAWALEHGVSMERVTVGGCSVELGRAPAAPVEMPRRPQSDDESRMDIYRQYGGALLKHAVSAGRVHGGGESPRESADMYEPALEAE